MTAQPRITHSAPLPNIILASNAHRTRKKTTSIPIATPAAMNRCRQVSTTIISAMLAYSNGPDWGANITSRAWLVIGPGSPYPRAAISSARMNPMAATVTAAHRITLGRRHVVDAKALRMRGTAREAMGIT